MRDCLCSLDDIDYSHLYIRRVIPVESYAGEIYSMKMFKLLYFLCSTQHILSDVQITMRKRRVERYMPVSKTL